MDRILVRGRDILGSYETHRMFQLWDYSSSHRQLLYRSSAGNDGQYNLDLRFLGVDWMSTSTIYEDLSVEEVGRDHLPEEASNVALSRNAHIYLLRGASGKGCIAARDMNILENDADLYASTLTYSEAPSDRARHFEKAVAAELANALHDWHLSSDVHFGKEGGASRVDFYLESPDKSMIILVEAKSSRRKLGSTDQWRARSQLVSAAKAYRGTAKIGLLLVVDGGHPDKSRSVKTHMEGQGAVPVIVVEWLPGSQGGLREEVVALSQQLTTTPGPT